jgi:hypothetical protein
MKNLQRQTSINDLAVSLISVKQATGVIADSKIEAALAPLKKIIRDAFRQGGKIGAARVRDHGEEAAN